MIRVPLRLGYRGTDQRPVTAWLVPGSNVAQWISEWTRWQLPMANWKVVPIEGYGALTILAPGQQLLEVTPSARFGSVGNRIFLPTSAMIQPAVSGEELDALIPAGAQLLILLPDNHVYSARSEQIFSISDVLNVTPASSTDWSCAEPGLALNDRLFSVLPESIPGLEDILNEGQEDIGSRTDALGELPPRPDEPSNDMVARAKRSLGQAASGIAKWMSNHLASQRPQPAPKPGTGQANAKGAGISGGSGPFGSLLQGAAQSFGEWARRVSQKITREMSELRQREIRRLLHMLEHDPDDGLKYAISLSGDAHRGRVNPTNSLIAQNVDFSLQVLGGGSAADCWNMDWEHRLELERRYRELANRELKLRRYRRAAYIFASLLGEFAPAASALRAGGHWREAAVLYEKRLMQPRAAADCLEQGGLFDEAIPLYVGVGDYEKVGDLYVKLEQFNEASIAWRQAIHLAIHSKQDFLEAARIAQKLKDDDETFSILERGWRESSQAQVCLQLHFRLLAERGWHDRALKLMRQVSEVSSNAARDVLTAESLSNIVLTYPDRDFCEQTADCVRVLAASHLRGVEVNSRKRLVKAVEQLVPGDQLLRRDGQRFITQIQPPPPPPRARSWNVLAPQPRIVNTLQLPEDIAWKAFVATGSHFYCAGIRDAKLRLFRGRWTGQLQEARPLDRVSPMLESANVFMAAEYLDRGIVLLASNNSLSEIRYHFPASHDFPEMKRGLLHHATSKPWDPKGVCLAHGLAYIFQGDAVDYALGFRIIETSLEIERTIKLEHSPDLTTANPIPAYGRHDLLAVGLGTHLAVYGLESTPKMIELPHTIEHLAGSAPYSRLRIIAGLSDGAAFFYSPAGHKLSEPRFFAQDLVSPLVCITSNGLVVALSEGGGEIYQSLPRIILNNRMPPLGERPVAIAPTGLKSQFAVLSVDGTVTIFEA